MQQDIESPFAILAKHQKKPPVDLDGIARDLGIAVFCIPLGGAISGQLMRDRRRGGSSGFAAFVNADEHPNRQRFSLAHEIAHYILHRDLIQDGVIDDTMYRSTELSSAYETQANRLAADILMPIMLVKQAAQLNPDPVALARMFRVSPAAMKIRLDGLKRPADVVNFRR